MHRQSIFDAIDQNDQVAITKLSKFQINKKNESGYSPLSYAMIHKKFQAAQRLIELKADIITPQHLLTIGKSLSPLAMAAIYDNSENRWFLAFFLTQLDPLQHNLILDEAFCDLAPASPFLVIDTFLKSNRVSFSACVRGYIAIVSQPQDALDATEKKNALLRKIMTLARDINYESVEGYSDHFCAFIYLSQSENESIRNLRNTLIAIAKTQKPPPNGIKIDENLLSITCQEPESVSGTLIDFLLEKDINIELPTCLTQTITTHNITQEKKAGLVMGKNSLVIAIINGNVNIVKKLIAKNVNVNTRIIVYPQYLEPTQPQELPQQVKATSLIEEKNLNETEVKAIKKGRSQVENYAQALRLQSKLMDSSGKTKTITIHHSKEIGFTYVSGITPLMLLSKRSFAKDVSDKTFREMMDALLTANPNLEAADIAGKTALMYAVESNNIYAVEKLLIAGATIDVESYEGETALTLAEKNKNLAILRILQDHQKSQMSTTEAKNEASGARHETAQATAQLLQFSAVAAQPKEKLKEKLTPLEALLKETPENKTLLDIQKNYALLRQLLEFVPDAALPLSPQLIIHRNAMLGTLGRLLRQINLFVETQGRGTQLFPQTLAKQLANIEFHSHGTDLAKVITNASKHKKLNKKVINLVKVICDLMDDPNHASEKMASIEISQDKKYHFLKKLLATPKKHDPSSDEVYDQLTFARREYRAYQKITPTAQKKPMLEMAMHYTNARVNTYVDDELLSSLEDQFDYEKLHHGQKKGYLFRHPELLLEPLPDFFWQTTPLRPPSPRRTS